MSRHFKIPSLRGLALAAVSVVAFASTFVAGTELTRDCGVSPAVLAFLRFAIAGGLLFVLEAAIPSRRRNLFALSGREWCLAATLGPIGTGVMAWCVFKGCAMVSTANASMADALAPLLIFVLAACETRKVTGMQLLGVSCGFLGVLLVIGVVNAQGIALTAYTLGDVYVLLAAITWAFYSVYGRKMINRLGPGPYTVWTMLAGAAVFGLLLPWGDCAWPATPRAWWLVVVLGVVCTLVPFWAWNAAQRYLSVSVLGTSAYFTPVAAVALAYCFRGETATWLQVLGTGLVVVSAVVEFRER